MLYQTNKLSGSAGRKRALSRYFLVAIVTGAIFVGGVTCGLILRKTNVAERAFRELAELGRRFPVMNAEATRTFTFESIETTLTPLELVRIPIGAFSGGGGAIAVIGNHIMFATPQGRLGFLRQGSGGSDYEIRHIDAVVPMNRARLKESAFARDPQFNANYFRTFGMLSVRRADGRLGLYVSHHRYAEECIEFVVSRVSMVEAPDNIAVDESSWEDIFVADPCIRIKTSGHPFAGHLAGGRLARTSGNTLMVTIGDHEFDGVNSPIKASVDPQTHLGKAVEINLDTKDVMIFASGLRNPQGLFISSDGLIWETEHGPHGGDELNVLQRGKNYGWPEVSYGVNYGFPSRPWPANEVQGRHDGYTKPVFSFVPSIGISNLIETDSNEFPLWKGDLLVTSLKDTAIRRLRRDADRIIYSERIHLGERLRDIQALPNGQLVVLTDNANVIVIRRKSVIGGDPVQAGPTITVSGFGTLSKVMADESLFEGSQGSGAEFGKEVFKARCSGCHAISAGPTIGPPLRGVVGRKIGSVEGYPYSDALASARGVWTRQRLLDFLSNPEGNFDGTTMPEVILPYRGYEPIIEFLETAD